MWENPDCESPRVGREVEKDVESKRERERDAGRDAKRSDWKGSHLYYLLRTDCITFSWRKKNNAALKKNTPSVPKKLYLNKFHVVPK